MSAPEINLFIRRIPDRREPGIPRPRGERTGGAPVPACSPSVGGQLLLPAGTLDYIILYYTVEVRRREKVCVRTCWCCVLTSGIYTETRATYAGRKRAACMLLLYLSEIETKGSRCTWGACWDSFLAHFLKVLCLGSNNFL
jgi:hypothetical protein